MIRLWKYIAAVLFLSFWSGDKLYAQSDQALLLSDLDIPLMQGFQEEENSRVVFDTPEGRIIEVQAAGPNGMAEVFSYYMVTLPSLSWRAMSENSQGCNGAATACITARREGEILTIKIRDKNGQRGGTVIYFSVHPE